MATTVDLQRQVVGTDATQGGDANGYQGFADIGTVIDERGHYLADVACAWRRLVESVGFKKEGTLREYLFRDDRYWDKTIYGMLEAEYRASE